MKRGSRTAWVLTVLLAGLSAQSVAGVNDNMEHHHSMGPTQEHWSAPAAAAKRPNPIAADKASIEQGRHLFEKNCVSCHGPAGRGDGPAAAALKPRPADLAMMAGHHPDGDLAWKIANGRGAMPSWKDTLSDQQIWILVNYIKSLGGTFAGPTDGAGHRH